MKNKCWKITDKSKLFNKQNLQLGSNIYTLQTATDEELGKGILCLQQWKVEYQYEVQVCDSDSVHPHYDKKIELQDITFEELIFSNDECIGIFHKECLMLFDDENTHGHKKYLGEIPISHDQSHDVYDYYTLKRLPEKITFSESYTTDDPHMQYTIGLQYLQNGDAKKGEEFLTKAANQGYVAAQCSLGIKYIGSVEKSEVTYDSTGEVLSFPTNNQLGLELLRKAADQGNQFAIQSIIFLYSDDIGITEEEYEHYLELEKQLL